MAETEVRHVHVFSEEKAGHEPPGDKRRLAQDTDTHGSETSPKGVTQTPHGALYRIASAARCDLTDKPEADHEHHLVEHLKKMAKEHGEFKAQLDDMKAKHKETEAKHAKAEVGRLVTMKVIPADEKKVAAALKLRTSDPETFETLYGDALAGQRQRQDLVDDKTTEARILLASVTGNRTGPLPAQTADGGGEEEDGESLYERAVKIMNEDKTGTVTFQQASAQASKQMRVKTRTARAGAR